MSCIYLFPHPEYKCRSQKLPSRLYFEAERAEEEPQWDQWKGVVRDVSWSSIPSDQSNLDLYQFRVMPSDHPLPPKARCGVQFDTYSVNPESYLPWMKSQLEGRGVRFMRRRILSLDEAGELAGEGGVVINATALGEPPEQIREITIYLCALVQGARSLLGVQDTDVYPIRGQVVLLYAPNVNELVSLLPNGKQL
jgi:D-amino-acid oxidase